MANLKWSKTLQDHASIASIPVAAPPVGSSVNPVAIIADFFHSHPVHSIDPCFSYYKDGRLHVVTRSAINAHIKDLMLHYGVCPDRYSSHSLRRGAATLATHSGVNQSLLQSHGTWRSMAYQRYVDFSYQDKLSVTQNMYKHFQ